jgi:molecular chaperone GrpE
LDGIVDTRSAPPYVVAAAVAAAAAASAVVAAAAATALARRAHRATLEQVRLAHKRAKDDVAKAHKYGAEPLARSLVPALDALDRLVESARDSPAMLEGALLTRSSVRDALRAHDIRCVEPVAKVDSFDVESMEALFVEDVPPTGGADGGADGIVSSVVRPGYVLHDRVLRAAQVGVFKSAR